METRVLSVQVNMPYFRVFFVHPWKTMRKCFLFYSDVGVERCLDPLAPLPVSGCEDVLGVGLCSWK